MGSKRAGKWMDGRMDIRDERMDRWKDRNSPNVLQDFIPFGVAALLPFVTSIRRYNRQTHVPIFDFYTLLNTFKHFINTFFDFFTKASRTDGPTDQRTGTSSYRDARRI